MPILWNEPFGIVMAEAMACGTPVIGLSNGSVPEVIDNGITGYVCDSTEEMVEAVNNIDKINRATVRSETERRFSSKVIAGNYLQLYNKRLS
jgi:glycosyltransferase involved in cell wall biosynthesis